MDELFTLQLLHASDLEGGVEAIANAPNFAALVDDLEEEFENTAVISAGDNYIPGPFFSAAGNSALAEVFQATYEDFYDLPAGALSGLEEGVGRVDISIMNFVGFDASAIGNHEFDLGPDAVVDIIAPAVDDSDDDGTLDTIEWLGAQFPYLSTNLDFSSSPLADLFVSDIEPVNTFTSEPPFEDLEAIASTPKLAPASILEQNGEQIGIIGLTTPLLQSLTSPGSVELIGPTSNDVDALAEVVQPTIDALAEQGINKVVLTTHLQQISLEQELVPLLSGVDIVIAGGSDTILADGTDELLPGDEVGGDYPLILDNADGDPVAIVSTAGEYTYVGRLVVDFDSEGIIVPDSIDPALNGPIATTDENVLERYDSLDAAFADGTRGDLVQQLTNAVAEVVNEQDSNIFGSTEVFLDGQRESVRTEETNLGNLTADANLFYADFYDDSVQVSIKNGGGIRAPIGEVADDGTLLPPQPNPVSGKEEGEISQLDITNSLRFNNSLSLLTLTAEELVTTLEFAVSATEPGATPGQFPQVAGINFSFDPTAQAIELDEMGNVVTEGDRLQSVALTGEDGTITDVLLEDGELVGDPDQEIRLVTLNFLAGGGDGYPFAAFGENQVDLPAQPLPAAAPNEAMFADPGTEQDALAEYLAATFPADDDPETPVFDNAETPPAEDERIQNLSAREDTVLEGAPTDDAIALDFEGLELGAVITDQFADQGILVSTDTEFGAMIFNSEDPTGGDDDLSTEDEGNVLIISEDGDSTDPDDAARGGTLTFEFDDLVGVASVGLLDIDESGSAITFFAGDDSVLETVEIPEMGDNSLQELAVAVENVSRIEIALAGSGAITDIEFSSSDDAMAIASTLADPIG